MNSALLIFLVVFASVANTYAALSQPKEDICFGIFKDLTICKMRGMVEQVIKETEDLLSAYSAEIAQTHAEFNQRSNFENPEGKLVKNALEKRKSAFVRFGKRSNDEPNSRLNDNLMNLIEKSDMSIMYLKNDPQVQVASVNNFHDTADLDKRKSSYLRFGKR